MARTVDVIKAQITYQVNINPVLNILSFNPSEVAIFKAWIFVQAVTIAVFEQLIDYYKAAMETSIDKAAVGSDYWIQKKILEFQYDAGTPQIAQLDTTTFSVGYNPVDVTKRIISRASVKTNGVRTVSVKVATGEPPVALTVPQLTALQNYLYIGGDGTYAGRGVGICFAGVQIKATSLTSDKVYLKATINYNGQYAAVIQANVILAINNYFKLKSDTNPNGIDFDGQIKVLTLVDAIQAVPGVFDIKIEDLAIRANTVPFANKTYLIQAFTELYTSYPMIAGYCAEENTVGSTFADTLTFISI